MSYGFHRHGGFRIVAAVDLEIGKPCEGVGTLACNRSYERNIGRRPISADLGRVSPRKLRQLVGQQAPDWDGAVDVLISCAPCTGFSRVKAHNHLLDDPKNSLVRRSADFVEEFQPQVFLMENARELIMGRFQHHYQMLGMALQAMGYRGVGEIHFLNRFGLPQSRERALVIAVRSDITLYTLGDLWEGHEVNPTAVAVRRAIGDLPPLRAGSTDPRDPMHTCPSFANGISFDRLRAMPHDGGGWADLIRHPDAERLLTPAMKRSAARGDFGSHPDVYGRLWWDKPAVTIKRECSHQGNGRYSHPEQDRMLSVREMAILQGFPKDYVFVADGIANMYRHIGDAVPPLISYQLAHLVSWMLTGNKPGIESLVLPRTHLKPTDIVRRRELAQYELSMSS